MDRMHLTISYMSLARGSVKKTQNTIRNYHNYRGTNNCEEHYGKVKVENQRFSNGITIFTKSYYNNDKNENQLARCVHSASRLLVSCHPTDAFSHASSAPRLEKKENDIGYKTTALAVKWNRGCVSTRIKFKHVASKPMSNATATFIVQMI